MNPYEKLNPEDEAVAKSLEAAAHGINPTLNFQTELEKQLAAAHKPKRAFAFPSQGKFISALGWSAALVVLAFILNWASRSLSSITPATGDGFICPVTEPNGSLPPNETVASANYLGNGELWTTLWPDGKVIMEPYNQEADGSFSMKWGWVRAVTGPLTIEGHRLDAEAEPLRADIPDGYGDTGFQVSALIFPTTGCWEVTGRVGESSLTFVTEVINSAATLTPESQTIGTPSTTSDTVPTPEGIVYDWNGTPLYLNASMPDTPSEMKIYLARDEVRASVDDVQALASRFNMNGEIYETTGALPDTTDYVMIDGNRQLRVRSDRYYTYYPNYVESTKVMSTIPNPNAEALVNEFLQTYGFTDGYQLEYLNPVTIMALSASPDGYSIRMDGYMDNGLVFKVNQNGIISVEATFLKYDEVKTASIISAQEALDRLIAPVQQYDNVMSALTKIAQTETWDRTYPLDESITYYGWLTSTGKSVSGGAPYISLNNYPVTGNAEDISENLENTFVEAIGRFHEENGVRTFEMESWKKYDGYEEFHVGTLQREGDTTVIVTNEGSTFTIPDVPADISLPAENIAITGVARGNVFEWQNMHNGPLGGGGGGGGGLGFFKLNLSGTPIPLPTLAPTPTPEPVDVTPIEGLRGIFTVIIFEKEDGTRRSQYNFMASNTDQQMTMYYALEGDLQELEKYNNRPVDIWGTPGQSKDGQISINVDRYEIPYPDLEFQLMTGTQKLVTLEGQPATLFTAEDGTQYAQLYSDGSTGNSLIGAESDQVVAEVLVIPDETFGGYPALRLFGGGLAVDPVTGQSFEYPLTAGEPNVIPDTGQFADYTLTIEKVELVYYTPDQHYTDFEPTEPPYLQPVWRFYGHYSYGDEFEILMQALKDEYLLPTHINEP